MLFEQKAADALGIEDGGGFKENVQQKEHRLHQQDQHHEGHLLGRQGPQVHPGDGVQRPQGQGRAQIAVEDREDGADGGDRDKLLEESAHDAVVAQERHIEKPADPIRAEDEPQDAHRQKAQPGRAEQILLHQDDHKKAGEAGAEEAKPGEHLRTVEEQQRQRRYHGPQGQAAARGQLCPLHQ